MAYTPPAEMYDNLMHRVPFEVGPDFSAKWEGLREAGFSVSIASGELLAFKAMPDKPVPPMSPRSV